MAVLRRPVRSRPIRLFLISMFAIPLVCLVGLWVFAVSVTVPQADSDHNLNVSTAAVDTQGRELAVELPTERAETYLWLLSGRRSSKAPLLATRELVDQGDPARGGRAAHGERPALSRPAGAAERFLQ